LKHNEIITITGLDKSAVNRALKKLKDANLLLHEDNKGYQSKELSEQLF
jgi:DNA-binding transcriptional regulator GbsR (MarR family)